MAKEKTLWEGDDGEREKFFAEMGRCISFWSLVEAQIEKSFHRVTQMDAELARRIFYSTAGFEPRIRMLLAAMKDARIEPERKGFLKKLIEKAEIYSVTRNRIVHGNVIYLADARSKFNGQYVIVQGRDAPNSNPPEAEVLTKENLIKAAISFGLLAQCFIPVFEGDGKAPGKFPNKYAGLLQRLPVPAQARWVEAGLADRLPG